ncbi:glycosyltransferase [Stagnihabitans tardus]|uniref:Glycosyltransferase n=1 Tax=Stagnihabitans tardus TaxID=2699202 RepID=A0AAE4Y7Z0_9RHOB|nr:glycosyltransferase [Stagnihabitans tardus]NBZ86829.1 glycosyltransferase [Stagnihabitans tardus]
MTRTVIISHSHPKLRGGGGEVAAHRQFEHMRSIGQDAWFLGAAYDQAVIPTLFPNHNRLVEFAPHDHCFRAFPMDSSLMEHTNQEDEDALLAILLRYKADVYHFHHFWNIGAGVVRRLRAARPEAKLICTLHEFIAICMHDGQMVKRNNGQLCTESSAVSCALCFPYLIPAHFVVRKHRLQEMLACFDVLFSPSQFLADRFIAWGLPEAKLKVLENGLMPEEASTHAPPPDRHRRFAYFGQATPTKGLDVLLRAARRAVEQDEKTDFTLDIHGVTEERFRELWPKEPELPDNVRFRGTYRPTEVLDLMRGYGWVVVPSVWWENSPVVIQEARLAGTPVIASNIGGMKEKVGGWGELFPVGDSETLSRMILSLSADVALHQAALARITAPLMIDEHVKLLQDQIAAL